MKFCEILDLLFRIEDLEHTHKVTAAIFVPMEVLFKALILTPESSDQETGATALTTQPRPMLM